MGKRKVKFTHHILITFISGLNLQIITLFQSNFLPFTKMSLNPLILENHNYVHENLLTNTSI